MGPPVCSQLQVTGPLQWRQIPRSETGTPTAPCCSPSTRLVSMPATSISKATFGAGSVTWTVTRVEEERVPMRAVTSSTYSPGSLPRKYARSVVQS